MAKYKIQTNWLMDKIPFEGTLEEAKAKADELLTYTQDITIYGEDGRAVAYRNWCEDGYYSSWQEYEWFDMLREEMGWVNIPVKFYNPYGDSVESPIKARDVNGNIAVDTWWEEWDPAAVNPVIWVWEA